LVAPSISEELIEIAGMERLPIDFIELSKFDFGETTFITVERRETSPLKTGLVVSQKEWNWDWYLKSKNAKQKQIEMAKHLYNQILTLSEKKGWNIIQKFNKWYISFKCGHFNCCWLEFRHRDKISLGVNIKDEEDDPSKISKVKWSWDKNWKFWYLETDNPKFNIEEITNVLDKAYKNTIGF
jgi:predicted transport protein